MHTSPLSAPSAESHPFGCLPGGEPVTAWQVTGAGGMKLHVLDYGGIVTRLEVPDANGALVDVALGFDRLEPYLESPSYFGAIIGRIAGRIRGARLTVEGTEHQLPANGPGIHLHGGHEGFHRKIWRAQPATGPDGEVSLILSHRSPAGDEGYPGQLDVTVTYTLSPDNSLRIDSVVTADVVTPVSLTHHTYFNLAGEGDGDILDHRIRIFADEVVLHDDALLSLHKIAAVDGRACDFRQPTVLGKAIPGLFLNHGDLYRIPRKGGRDLVHIARVEQDRSGIALDVRSNEDYLQFYTAVHCDGSEIGKSGLPYKKHAGFCLECEGYPEGVAAPVLGDILVRPGEPQRRTTIYSFTTGHPGPQS